MLKVETLIRGGLDTLSKFGRSALEYVLQETKCSLSENTVKDFGFGFSFWAFLALLAF
jgi:hypothetical protein